MKPLIVGADPFPPYQDIKIDGTVYGTDYDTVKTVIDKMGFEAQYIIKEWALIEKMFNNKDIDIVFQIQKTPEREKKWYISDKLRDAVTAIVTSAGNTDYSNINDIFSGQKKLAVMENYQYGEKIDSIDAENKVYFKSTEDLLKAVNNYEVSFGVVDLGVFTHINGHNIYNNLKVINNLNFNRPLYVAFNSESIRDKFNICLKELWENEEQI